MLLASAVVVWEWLNEHGRWRPYSPAVSHQIEAAIRSSDPRGGSVVLGQVDSRLSPYIIDLQSMHQFRQDTGTAGGAPCGAVMFCISIGRLGPQNVSLCHKEQNYDWPSLSPVVLIIHLGRFDVSADCRTAQSWRYSLLSVMKLDACLK